MRDRLAGVLAGIAALGSLTGAGQLLAAPAARAAGDASASDGDSSTSAESTTSAAGAATATTTTTTAATSTTLITTTTAATTSALTTTTTTGPTTTTTATTSAQAAVHQRSLLRTFRAEQRAAASAERRQTATLSRQLARGRRRAEAQRRARARRLAAERAAVAARAAASARTATAASAAGIIGSTTSTLGAVGIPARDRALSRLSHLLANGDRPPAFLMRIDKAAARRYGVPWTALAAINIVETDDGADLRASSAGAEGWMQFMPATWHKYGESVTSAWTIDHSRTADPDNPRDAIFSAARYLRASGGGRHLRRAVFAYNHARWYVDEVLLLSAHIAAEEHVTHGARAKLRLMLSTAEELDGLPYLWGGGHSGWKFVDGYDCSGFVSAVLHAAGYLSAPDTTQTLADQRGIVSGPGRFVTIFDRTDAGLGEDHVIIEIDGQWWESGGQTTAGVHRIRKVSAAYLATFNRVLHPRGL